MKSLKLLAISTIIATSTSYADTYTTNVQVDNLAQVLSWYPNTEMRFPTVLLDGNTPANAKCYTSDYSPEVTDYSLCPGSRTDSSNAVFDVHGISNATANVVLDTTPIVIEGIEFTPAMIGTNVTFNEFGAATYEVGGQLTLIDKNANISSSVIFNYNLEFTAQ